MATTQSPRRRTPATIDGARTEATLERLNASLDAAQDAVKALRRDLRGGRRDMAKNLDTLLRTSRRDSSKLAKAVRGDLADLQKAVTSPPARRPAPAKKSPARTRTARRTTGTRSTKS